MEESHGRTDTEVMDGEPIELNVGGSKFTTSQDTLCRIEGSYFDAMFSGRHTARKCRDGSYFIDRDGSHFRHILNYLRHGSVVTLPPDTLSKEELAVEADFYGIKGLVEAIRMPKMDYTECAPEHVVTQWKMEQELRNKFCDGTANEFCQMDPYRYLIPLFRTANEEDVSHTMPLKFNPNSETRQEEHLFMSSIRGESIDKNERPNATVSTLEEFQTNFNRDWPNLLHRLGPILRTENVIIAGGSVLRALTATQGIRTADFWERKDLGGDEKKQSDVDLFLYACSEEEASRIARRIFYAVAADNEIWVVVRGRGVINMSEYARIRSWRMGMKIQIVLRVYDSPTEVLIGFDVDSCCCAYNGRNVWVCPRWISSLQSGVNVLNPLHAWLNKASYEMRLAKYAYRGFPVFVPGMDRKRIDYNRIQKSKISDIKGFARFIKVSSEMESATSFKWREYEAEDEGNFDLAKHEQPRLPSDVPNLRLASRNLVTEDADRLIDGLDRHYDLDEDVRTSRCIIPRVYPVHGRQNGGPIRSFLPSLWLQNPGLPNARESRDEAWQEIEDAGENVPQSVPRLLRDAWDTSKRSREYLNGQMDKYDLDNFYYGTAYHGDNSDD